MYCIGISLSIVNVYLGNITFAISYSLQTKIKVVNMMVMEEREKYQILITFYVVVVMIILLLDNVDKM